MIYATAADMISAFGEAEVIACTDRAGIGEMDGEVLDAALVSASSEADSYLARRYELPPAAVPAALVSAVCDIARYRLSGGPVLETDPVKERYKLAIEWLRRVADGAVTLPELLPPEAAGDSIMFFTGRRVFAAGPAGDGEEAEE